MFKRTILQQTRQVSRQISGAAHRVAHPVMPARVLPTVPRIARPFSHSSVRANEKKPEEASKEQQAEETVKENLAQETAELEDITKQLETVQKELEKKTAEARDFKDKFTRAVADYRNLQDRTERDKKAAKEFAIQKFAKDLCDSVDNLDRALKAVPEEARKDPSKNKELVDLYNGLKMTEDILLSTMKKHGLEKIDPLDEVFDPNVHEATFQTAMPGKEPGTVFHVQQTGFILNGRTIRAAKVGVVAKP